MRTARIAINGTEYLLCFSARVMRACAERYGSVEHIGKALTEGTEAQMMDESFWLLSEMMEAGARYARMEDLNAPPPLSCDDLYDVCSIEDLTEMQTRIFETVANGNERRIETESEEGKNAQTTRQDLMSGGASGTD